MSDRCCGTPAPTPTSTPTPAPAPQWWRSPAILIPMLSGVGLLTGLALTWAGLERAALASFWAGLLLGAATFAPGALRALVQKRRIGIALLMTISAVGAVILGYVAEAAALAFLYALAEALEDRAMDRARGSLRALLHLVPETATVIHDGHPTRIPAQQLRIGQNVLVRPGERVATDGIVRSGHSSLNTAAITGESMPRDVAPGDPVSAGSINASGALEIEATADGRDNSLTTIVQLVEQAQTLKGERARLADRIARPLVPGVIVLATLVGVIGSFLGDPETWIARALVVLVAASPCALAIAVPVTVISAIGAASQFGVVVKSGAAFEQLGRIRHLAFDKTGTLTRNRPSVVAVLTVGEATGHEVLSAAAAIEQHSTHPIASAIAAAAEPFGAASQVSETPGSGVTGLFDGQIVSVGSARWLDPGPLTEHLAQLEKQGVTCVLVTRQGSLIGAIGVRDELRNEAPEVVSMLATSGVAVSMLTGDNERTAAALARDAGIVNVYAELRPEDKANRIARLVARQPTAMVGDGINDAPALAGASVGIAMGTTGSDAAIESADIAFTGQDLRLIPRAIRHARRGSAIMNQNIALSLAIIAVLLPLAITGALGLAAVVLVHEAAEVLVIANGLRAARVPRAAAG